ncbi:hypothetical protein EV175_006576, partial [Coemansia sp. RSA 1933]
MFLLSNPTSLLALALAASSLQLSSANPYPQQGMTTIVPKQQETDGATASGGAPKEGDACNDQSDRTVCADSTSLLFCRESKWVTYSNCTLGTVCLDGFCVYPDESSSGAQASAADQLITNDLTDSVLSSLSSTVAGQSDTAAAILSSGATDTAAGSGGSSSPVVSTSAAGAESTDAGTSAAASSGTPEESASADSTSSSSSDDTGGGGSSSSGSSYGITCDKFDKAVSAASKAIGQNYPTPSSAQCNAFIKGMETGGAISSAREAAMFLANILWESDGLRAKQEYDCVDKPDWCAQNYKTADDATGKTYWGRGYIQLTW